MKGYEVETLADLDDFDVDGTYWVYGVDYSVFVVETNEVWLPVYCFRENGDMDGFMGWK